MISLHNVTKIFKGSDHYAVQSVSLDIQKGTIHGMIGTSGAGKSTLLRLINLLESPDEGTVTVNQQELTTLSRRELREARRSIGMIFQQFNLLGNKTVFDNVAIPLKLSGYPKELRNERVMECLAFVGLEHFAKQYPLKLSGGQKQRVAIARALATKPAILLCDEPTSALDPKTTADILKVLQNVNEELGVTIVIVSHEFEVIRSICHYVSVMESGKIVETVSNVPQDFMGGKYDPLWFLQELKKGKRDAYA